jgi:4-amino-4-deoxy-L-arabinose transferase-like glycosyltransferase
MTDERDDERPSPRFAVALLAIVLAALVIRILFVVVVDPTVPRIGDASAYHLLAEHIAHGDGYIRPFDDLLLHKARATAEYPPLFPTLVAVPARLGMHSVESQRLFLALVGAGTVALIGVLGRRVGGRRVGLIAAALAAISPMLFQSEGILMAEALYVPLVAAAVLLTYRVRDDASSKNLVPLGVVLGLAALTRAEGLLIALVLVIPLCRHPSGASVRGRFPTLTDARPRGLVALGVAVLVVAPWTIRNAITFHAFVPVSNNVATLVDGANCDATYSGAQLGLWRETFTQYGDAARTLPQSQACFEGFDIADPHFDESKVADHHRHDGTGYATHHLGSLPKVMTARVLRTWGVYAPRQQVNFETLEGRPHAWQMRGTILDWVLLPLSIAGIVLLRRRRCAVWPLLATALAVTITAALTYGQQRFRVAAEPALCVLAAVAIAGLWQGAMRRSINGSKAATG